MINQLKSNDWKIKWKKNYLNFSREVKKKKKNLKDVKTIILPIITGILGKVLRSLIWRIKAIAATFKLCEYANSQFIARVIKMSIQFLYCSYFRFLFLSETPYVPSSCCKKNANEKRCTGITRMRAPPAIGPPLGREDLRNPDLNTEV